MLDLGTRLGWGLTDPTAGHVIIVVRIGEQLQGVIVDAVNDIVTVGPDDMQPLPDIGSSEAGALLDGLATIGQRMILVLDLDKLCLPLAEAARPSKEGIAMAKAKVLVVDDSLTMRAGRRHAGRTGISRSSVSPTARSKRRMVADLKPSVMTLDVEMPGMSWPKSWQRRRRRSSYSPH